jgi:hypothetical protein
MTLGSTPITPTYRVSGDPPALSRAGVHNTGSFPTPSRSRAGRTSAPEHGLSTNGDEVYRVYRR